MGDARQGRGLNSPRGAAASFLGPHRGYFSGRRPGDGAIDKVEGVSDMGIIGWIVLGLLAGAIAKLIMPGEDPGGFIVTMLIGIAGALVGGFIASALDIGDLDEFFDIGTWLIAIGGSLLLLFIYRMVAGDRTGHRGAYR